jgi:hypothetical protein
MTTEQRELISRAEYSRRKGVAPRTIGKYVQSGVIPTHNNKIDPVEADECLSKHLVHPIGSQTHPKNTGKKKPRPEIADDPDSKGHPDGNGSGTYVGARTREKQIKVELLELELKLKKGEMVLNKDVKYAAFTAARRVRDRMLNIPDRICAIVAAERDETKVRTIILGQIEKELDSLSKGNNGN